MKLVANITRMYGWRSASSLAGLYDQVGRRPLRYWRRYWTTQDATVLPDRAPRSLRLLVGLLRLGMVLQLVAGAYLLGLGFGQQQYALVYFGLAIVVAYPLVWAHLLPLLSVIYAPRAIKPLGKRMLCQLLEKQVVDLRAKHDFSLVAVAGSVGKTSTKLAVARTLAASRRVCYQEGNYNDRLTVPLVIFGHNQPGLFNVLAWLRILRANRRIIAGAFDYDTVVVELGTDGPGQMAQFAYLRPDLTLLTSIAPEHMEQFGTLRQVADEELTVFDYSQRVLVNIDDVAAKYLRGKSYVNYGSTAADYHLVSAKPRKRKFGRQKVTYDLSGRRLTAEIQFMGQQGAKVALAAAAAACEQGMPVDDIRLALEQLQPFAGRMQILPGIHGSTIIDDTYNASPTAVSAALDVLQSSDAPQRIAILGSMNELGQTSAKSHRQAGRWCDGSKLDLVVTIGREANDYLAPAAKRAGCRVETFVNPKLAGESIADQVQTRALILAKGSQNGVFAEEAVKQLLANPADASRLVRQSPAWLKAKRRQFKNT